MMCPKCGGVVTTSKTHEPLMPGGKNAAVMIVIGAVLFGFFTAGIGLIIGLVVLFLVVVPVPQENQSCSKCGFSGPFS